MVLDGPEGKREFILSETKKESDGEYKLTYKLKAIFADRNVTLTLVDADGEKLDLNLGSGAEVENDVFTYSIYDYAAYAKENFPAGKTLDLVNAMYTFGAYSAKWKYNKALPSGTAPLKELSAGDFEKYAMQASGTEIDTIEPTALSLVLDSNTALRLYFTCSDDIEGHSVTVGGKALAVKTSKEYAGEYYVDIENIGAKNLKKASDIKFDGQYTISVSPMTYVYNSLKSSTTDGDVLNVLKALCAYSDAADRFISAS